MRANGFKVFGPNKQAAQIEGSKLFAKKIMEKYNIPTADYKEVERKKDALTYIENCELPVVVKKDGLAAGKALLLQILLKQPEVLLRLCMVMKKKVL